MNDWLSLGALTAAFLGPVVLVYANNKAATSRAEQAARIAHESKEEDWRRQDVVAARAAEAASLLLQSQNRVAVQVEQVAKVAAVTTASTEVKLSELKDSQEQIHTLVNSNLMAAMASQLAGLETAFAALTMLADNQEEEGKPIFAETRQKAQDLTVTIAVLQGEMNDRRLATERAQGNLEKKHDP